jgi:23S rRNA pseudouridine1911/1915/1917 synthase
MAYIGHPIVGDDMYNTKKKDTIMRRMALHAREISFVHPTTKEPMHFTSPLPADIKALIDTLKNK